MQAANSSVTGGPHYNAQEGHPQVVVLAVVGPESHHLVGRPSVLVVAMTQLA